MAITDEIKYCVRCGSPVIQAERFGRVRPVCPNCGWIYFADPKVAVAALIEQEGQVLLVQRINDPQRGLWTMPSGFLDAGEDPQQAAMRECQEETGLDVRITELAGLYAGQEFPGGSHLLIVYRAQVVSGQLQAGDDAGDARFFSLNSLPELAFSTTRKILGVD